jgi:hypothetical protein
MEGENDMMTMTINLPDAVAAQIEAQHIRHYRE